MSFTVRNAVATSYGCTELILLAQTVLHIPPLGFGIVAHDVDLLGHTEDSLVMLLPLPDVLRLKSLHVGSGPMAPGNVLTVVFNFSNRQVKIKQGESISSLISFKIG